MTFWLLLKNSSWTKLMSVLTFGYFLISFQSPCAYAETCIPEPSSLVVVSYVPSEDVRVCATTGLNTLGEEIPDKGLTTMQEARLFFSTLLDTSSWPPRWYCGDWSNFHGWLYIISDLLTWFAYFLIPGILMYFIVKREQAVTYHRLVLFFIAFILICGFTHLIDVVIFWVPLYKLSALLRSATAIISVMTVVSLIQYMPEVLKYKSPAETEKILDELLRVNEKLKLEVELRKSVELQNKDLNADLYKKVSELEAFSYSISHDLRSPLRAIHGFTDALMEDQYELLDETGKDYLKRISKGTVRMGHLIDDLLLLSKVSRQEIVLKEIDFTSLSKKVIEGFDSLYDKTSYNLNIAEGLTATGDERLVRIVLENLIGNAFKFSANANSPTITIGQDMKTEGHPFFIKDNGAGFDMEFYDKVFTAFQRLHNDKDYKGTGIGLAIVQRVISKHDGKIWAESVPNEGSTFYFNFKNNQLND